MGLCTGTFAAAAVSCSNSVSDLVPMAVDAVIAAFRTGMHVTEVAKRLVPVLDSAQSWSIIIPDSTSVEAVEEFCTQSVKDSSNDFALFLQATDFLDL